MSRFEFAVADPSDDAQLRARMAADHMDGDISVSFRREPSYFAGSALQGQSVQVIKCTERASGMIVGMGSRLKLLAYINGQACLTGYLGDLRAAPGYRNGTLLARGYRFLRELHSRDPVPFYYSVIFSGNQAALASLTGARAGLPVYRALGRVLTPALHLDFARRALALPGIGFGRAHDDETEDLIAFLNAELSKKQFAPIIKLADLRRGGRLAGLSLQDFFVARQGGRIVACVAAWDQTAIRQTHIERYSRMLKWMRPGYNLISRFSPLKPLPAPGARIPYLYFSLIAVRDNNAAVFRGLLRHAYNELRAGPWHYGIASLHERDPLAAVLSDYRRIDASGLLFVVHYPRDGDPADVLDARPPYVDMALV